VSDFFKSVNIWQSYKQERGCLMHFAHLANTLLKDEEMTCFADTNVSLGCVATYARCGGIFNINLTANLPRNLPLKKIGKSLRFDRIMVMTLWPRFFGPPCIAARAVVTKSALHFRV